MGNVDGNFYRGNKGCTGEGYSVFRTTNAGISWTEHPLPTSETGTADTWNAEEAQVEVDSSGNVHAMWMGLDDMPYWSYSRDQGATWSNATMIAPPIGLTGTGFPVVVAGDEGTVAFGYVGEDAREEEIWNAYLTYATDAFNETPLLTTVQLNAMDDPIDTLEDCGYNRCGGLGDFLDIRVDAEGRTWFALAHNIGGDSGADVGIFATFQRAQACAANITMLAPMPAGGPHPLSGKRQGRWANPGHAQDTFDGSPPPEEEQMSPLERMLFLGSLAVVGLLLLSFAYGLLLALIGT